MNEPNIPVFLLSGAELPTQVQQDLSEVLSELPAKVVVSPNDLGEDAALAVHGGILNPSPEHFDFLLEGLDDYDIVLQPSLSGLVLAIALDAGNPEARAIVDSWQADPKQDFLALAASANGKGLEVSVQPPWYGTIDGNAGLRFAYLHMEAASLNSEDSPLALRTLTWLREQFSDA
ncbi:MAG: hypothetical protein KDB07_06075 [Planctomycetes bacterium]|nr:hypothetical protein [Planctomycetota bacterium]